MSSQRKNRRSSSAWVLACMAMACGGNATSGRGNQGGSASLGGAPGAGAAGAPSVGGSTSQGGDAGSEPQCATDSQCPHSDLCVPCPDGSAACEWAKCEHGACVGGISSCAAGGASGSGGSDGGSGGKECQVAADCYYNHLGICENCSDGTKACSRLDCVDGRCVTSIPLCPMGAAGDSGTAGTGGV
ncbi:MAG TPA: hypothetical protein VER96_10955 [Polyangiaceae bacterium]|nr:hypothetical protein [Polyangiaceae bacterium]